MKNKSSTFFHEITNSALRFQTENSRNLKKVLDKLIIVPIFAICYLLFAISSAYASLSCQPIYGGGQTCVTIGNAVVNKKIYNPLTNVFVDNLGVNDPKYFPGYIVNFRIDVTNNGDTNIARVDVKDIFPQYVEFGSGPGNFDTNTKTLSFTLANLAPNETRIFGIVGKVVQINQLPDQSIVCVVNQAITTTSEGAISQDNSQFCIEKKSVAITKGGFPVLSPVPVGSAPSTGPESLVLFSLIPTGIAGWMLRKFSMKKEVN